MHSTAFLLPFEKQWKACRFYMVYQVKISSFFTVLLQVIHAIHFSIHWHGNTAPLWHCDGEVANDRLRTGQLIQRFLEHCERTRCAVIWCFSIIIGPFHINQCVLVSEIVNKQPYVTICLSLSSFYLLFMYVYYFHICLSLLIIRINHSQILSVHSLVFPSQVSVHLCDLIPSTPKSASLTFWSFPDFWYFLILCSLLVFLNFLLLS